MSELTLSTGVAHWGYHEHRYLGYRVFAELLGRESLSGLTALAASGRRLTSEECAVLDELAVALTLADPRIWPLKLTRLVAAYGSPLTAAATGMLILERARIGPSAVGDAAHFLLRVRAELGESREDPGAVEAVVTRLVREERFVPGFGTPFRDEDERLLAFRSSMARRGREQLPYFRLLTLLAPIVRELRRAAPNIALGGAAALLDLGFELDHVAALATALMHHMFIANALEGARDAPAWLRELPASVVRYEGPAPRASPRAEAAGKRRLA